MNLLKWIFGNRKPSVDKPVIFSNDSACLEEDNENIAVSESSNIKRKYDGFDIEYLPIAKKYFPRYEERYLFWNNFRQNYSLHSSIGGCEYSSSEKGAREIIDKYLELLGVDSVIIKLD